MLILYFFFLWYPIILYIWNTQFQSNFEFPHNFVFNKTEVVVVIQGMSNFNDKIAHYLAHPYTRKCKTNAKIKPCCEYMYFWYGSQWNVKYQSHNCKKGSDFQHSLPFRWNRKAVVVIYSHYKFQLQNCTQFILPIQHNMQSHCKNASMMWIYEFLYMILNEIVDCTHTHTIAKLFWFST